MPVSDTGLGAIALVRGVAARLAYVAEPRSPSVVEERAFVAFGSPPHAAAGVVAGFAQTRAALELVL